MNLQTQRLSLMPFSTDDLEIFHQTNTHPFVRKHLWDDEEIPITASTEVLQKVEKRFVEHKWGLWKIIHALNGEYMGYTGLWTFFDEAQPQLLYALLPEYTGKGFATEAARKIVDYAFEALGLDYLIASMDKPNEKSIQVGKKLHMHLMEEKEMDGKPTLFFRLNKSDHRSSPKWEVS